MIVKKIVCFSCKREFSPNTIIFECDKCHGPLDIVYDYKLIKKQLIPEGFFEGAIHHWKYLPFYPIKDFHKIVSFHEGGTPLIKSGYWFKYEGVNPTGSFKDRGSTVEITKAREFRVKSVVCASTGNMGASVAAYAARAGMGCSIYVPTIAAKEKILQIKAHGAKVVNVKGDYDKALGMTKELRKDRGVYLTGDYPYRGEGEKSVGYEIIDQLNWEVPDYIVCPVGNATLIYSVFKAVSEFKAVGLIKRIPKIVAVQAKKCNPIVKAFNSKTGLKSIKNPSTVASAIACGNPVDGVKALYGLKKSRGLAVDVSDKEILDSRKELGKKGIFAEPSGAVSFAGAKKLGLKGDVVCVISGHGLKDNKVQYNE
ncbi:threonine synthase [Candidatus Woesearchaeota archaeon]|nr:threonine synthase [Candidatus Woesearchaeota archaeon]